LRSDLQERPSGVLSSLSDEVNNVDVPSCPGCSFVH
jgi:hypothetical protein